jgi:hypothetical protein
LDPLLFWLANATNSVFQPLLPLIASISAVPTKEDICELLFKALGQVMSCARLWLLGTWVESILITNFKAQHVDAAV